MSIILPYQGVSPKIDLKAYIAEGAAITGDVEIGTGSSVWFNVTIRGDVNHVRIGKNTNIQDGAVCHVTFKKFPLIIGDNVTIGHNATVHACTIHDECLIGMGSCILDGAVVEKHAMVAAGAVVGPGKVVKSGELWAGVPAKPVRKLTQEELDYLPWSAQHYVKLGAAYKRNKNDGE